MNDRSCENCNYAKCIGEPAKLMCEHRGKEKCETDICDDWTPEPLKEEK